MQIYAIKMFNFFRFGEKNNCIVFDMLPKYSGHTIDEVYEMVRKDPASHINEAKKAGLTSLIGISGAVGSDFDYSNGTGKSTVLEAICYAIYDQIVRRTANTDKTAKSSISVVTRLNGDIPKDLKETYVEMIFGEGGKIYRLKRGRSIKSATRHEPILRFDDVTNGDVDSQSGHRTTDTNESITKVVNMDYEVFVNSVMFGQSDAGAFLTGTDKTRKEMLINLLHLQNIVSGCLQIVRDRKNAKASEIKSLEVKVEMLENSLKSKDVNSVKEQIGAIKTQSEGLMGQIRAFNEKIEGLSKSEVIKALERIKEEGKKVKDSLIAQKEAKESQIKEWKSLHDEAEKQKKSQLSKMESIIEKRKEVQTQIVNLELEIKGFDLAPREQELKKVEKAKSVKPEYEGAIKGLQVDKEKIAGDIASESSEYKRLEKEVKALKDQLVNAGNKDEFVCDKCKSKVAKSHVESEIGNNEIKMSDVSLKLNEFKAKQNSINSEFEDRQKKLVIINGYLIRENKIRAEIQENEGKKQKLEGIKKIQAEDYGKIYEDIKSECVSIQLKKDEYVSKINEVSSKYDSEIEKTNKLLLDLSTKYTETKKSAEEIENQIKGIRDSIQKSTNDKSQLDSKIGFLRKEIENIQSDTSKLAELKKSLSNEMVMHNRLSVLDSCFGLEGIQTRIIAKYLPILNVYIAELMDILSNGAMSVRLVINSRSEVDIFINGGSSESFVMLSGGEKMVVRMAVDIGLALLSFTRCCQKPEVICLDEVFGPLDNSHIEAVFKLLRRLQDKFTRVLVISHKAEINELIPHHILVEKDEGAYGRSRIKEIS